MSGIKLLILISVVTGSTAAEDINDLNALQLNLILQNI